MLQWHWEAAFLQTPATSLSSSYSYTSCKNNSVVVYGRRYTKVELSWNFKVVLSHFGSGKMNNVVVPVSSTVEKGIGVRPPALLEQVPKSLLSGLLASGHRAGSTAGEKPCLETKKE